MLTLHQGFVLLPMWSLRLAVVKLEKKFVDEATASGLLNLRGHSIGGGIRASIYNAISENEVMQLCDFMRRFKTNHLKSKLRLPSKHHSRANVV